MKKQIIIIIALIIWGTIGAGESLAHRQVVSGYFYNGLSPYGSWVELDYGVVVWRPTVMRVDWSPYGDGRWIWTTDGWYWDSYEPFGYITYHYGRWYFDDYYGWLWYPDYEWAPAWVEWRYDDDYIGWAPLHPYAIFSISIGIHFTTTYYTPYYHWNFVTYHNFYNPHVYNYCLGPKYKYRVYSNTRYRTNYGYHNGRIRNNGVDVEIVRKRTSSDIRQLDIENVSDPVALNNRTNDNGRVRTFYKTRDELVRNEVRDVKFEKSDRKSSLDVTKIKRDEMTKSDNRTSVDRNRNNDVNKRETQNNTFSEKDRINTNNDRKINRTDERNKTGNDINRNKNDVNLNRKIDKNKQNNDVKRNTTNNKREIRTQTNENKKRQEININKNNTQQNREIKVNKNNQQTREIKVNRNNTQKKQEVKVNRNNTQKNRETKVNRNTGNDQNRKKKR